MHKPVRATHFLLFFLKAIATRLSAPRLVPTATKPHADSDSLRGEQDYPCFIGMEGEKGKE